MKNNRTNRKLKFIREKNNLRLGKTVFTSFISVNENDLESSIATFIEMTKNRIHSIYNFSLRYLEIKTGHNGNDFIQNKISILLTFSNNKKYETKN